MLSRRKFLGLCAAGIAGTACSVALQRDTTFDLEHVEQVFHFPGLPQDFHQFRIGLLSDLHLGISMPDSFLEAAVSSLHDAQIDLLVLAGDYLWVPESTKSKAVLTVRNKKFAGPLTDDLLHSIYTRVCQIVTHFPAKHGVLAVPGNHDNWLRPDIFARACAQHGIEFLRNNSKIVKRGTRELEFYGAEDFWTGIPLLPGLRRKQVPRILVTHNPDLISYALKKPDAQFDLALCGHTHGGQILPFGLGPLHYNIRDRRFQQGWFTGSAKAVYTTRGLGFVEIPYRINCRPEASVLTLIQA